ncbi:MAG: RNA-binding protein [Flavobacteriaceae bacterium]|nr:RNA-binding protein [Flavobacteriaceae bacterium]
MTTQKGTLSNCDQCKVVKGVHIGKTGKVRDINTSKTGHITITGEQANGLRFKAPGKNVVVETSGKS